MSQKTALIIGASRGLGLGLVEQLAQNGWHVTATVRDDHGASNIEKLPAIAGGALKVERLDINHRAQVDAFANAHATCVFDLIFVNAGIYGPSHQSLMQMTADDMGQLVYTNAIAPAQIGQLMHDRLRQKTGVLAFMSSLRGCITNNTDGAATPYRISKVALNMAARSLFPALAVRGNTMLMFHPGWVQTDMGGDGAPVTVADSVRGMLGQVEKYAGSGTQYFLDYQGNILPW